MGKFHIDSIQEWDDFEHDGQTYSLKHLDAHEVVYQRGSQVFRFVVTYSLHCFTKDETSEYAIETFYEDGRESRQIDLERYEASKNLPRLINALSNQKAVVFETSEEKFFTINRLNSFTGKVEPYKIAFTLYKERRLRCLHVLTAFFARTGEGSEQNPVVKKGKNIFSVASALERKEKRLSAAIKEVRNQKK